MIRDALVTAGFLLVIYLAVRGAASTCADVADFWRTCVRARRS